MCPSYLERLSQLESEVEELLSEVNTHTTRISKLEERVKNVELHQELHWKDKAILLKKENSKLTYKQIAEACGVGIDSMKRYMALPATKKLLK